MVMAAGERRSCSSGASLTREILDPDDYFRHSYAHHQRVQFRRMYRYGLALLLVGALCNWIGFAQHYFTPVRYLGVGCVLAGALCICAALCRWLTARQTEISQPQDLTCGGAPSIHVIAIPIQNREFCHPHEAGPSEMNNKPPDYETAIGTKPPSYDEAICISPAVFLHPSSSASSPPPITEVAANPAEGGGNGSTGNRSTCPTCSIDCTRCSGV